MPPQTQTEPSGPMLSSYTFKIIHSTYALEILLLIISFKNEWLSSPLISDRSKLCFYFPLQCDESFHVTYSLPLSCFLVIEEIQLTGTVQS